MKKRLIILIVLALVMVMAACGNTADAPAATPTATAPPATPAPTEETTPTADVPVETAQPSYKDTMLPFDELVPGPRIVILQNTLNYSRDGFYTEDNKPETQEITYNDETVAAYPISYTLDFLTNGCSGQVTVTNNDGSTQELSTEEFAGLFVIVDFTSDAPPVMYDPESGTELTDFLFAVTEEGESIYSVVSGATYNASELVASVGWDADVTCRYVATDKFYITVVPAENATGEIRGTLSGAINGSFPDLQVASGKINDVIYIEVPGE